MIKSKHKKISARNLLISLLVIVLWLIFWFGTQCLFMFNVPILSNWLIGNSTQDTFINLTIWIIAVCLGALGLWHLLMHDYSFLKTKNKWDLIAYIIPVILCLVLILTRASAFGVDMRIYIFATIVTVFCQDLLTTGFMQTTLSKTLGAVIAAVTTGAVFIIGHFVIPIISISDILTLMTAIMIVGFIVLSYLRYKRGNIYLANVIHISFALIMTILG